MIFANIEYLFLLILLIPYIVWYIMRRKRTEATLQVSTTRMYMNVHKKLESVSYSCTIFTPFVCFRYDSSCSGKTSDY